ncbi:MAG TPA: ABC transporter permease [Candidatus Limnocylindrales bacterium]|jgi:spermidine/putrescine transport system permease protein|nr:ABC transporter permease [Candidatus Limnocylindrales bacterium]
MAVEALARPAPRSLAVRAARFLDRYLLLVYTGFAVLYLTLPIAVMALFSFNDPPGRSNFAWHRFSLDAWLNPFGVASLREAVTTSVSIAFLSTIAATALGTLVALALVRYRFRGWGPVNLLIFLPMATPEIVLGASLLTLFVAIGQPPFFPTNYLTILIAHIMFNISYVVVTVRARLQGFDRTLEEAAMDLGANEWTTFWRVTFPIVLPGILAAALLAFSLSIDDFVVTNFTAGRTETFPIYIWGAARIGIPVQVNVIGTAMFVIAVGFVALTTYLQSRTRTEPVAAAPATR